MAVVIPAVAAAPTPPPPSVPIPITTQGATVYPAPALDSSMAEIFPDFVPPALINAVVIDATPTAVIHPSGAEENPILG